MYKVVANVKRFSKMLTAPKRKDFDHTDFILLLDIITIFITNIAG